MNMELLFLVMVPFWAAMPFINGKLVLELNKEWDEQALKALKKEAKTTT